MANRFFSPTLRGSDPLLGLYRDMNRLFDDVFAGASPSGAMSSFGGMPSLDVHEQGDGLCVAAELPGVKPSDIDVRLDGDMLTITGEKRAANEPQQNAYHVMERSYGRFSRTVQLPFRPDPDAVDAQFEHGVLVVRLERSPQQPTSRRIEVRSREGSGASSRQMHAGSGGEAPTQVQGTSSGAQQMGSAAGTGQPAGSRSGGQLGGGGTEPSGMPGSSGG